MSAREALHSSVTNEWCTPPWVLGRARALMGGIDLDPASCEAAQQYVKARRYYTEEDDGLSLGWVGQSVWLNPPYGRLAGRFVTKAQVEYHAGRTGQACLLVNAVPDRKWFRALWPFPIAFFHNRIRFIDANGVEQRSPTNGDALVWLFPRRQTPESAERELGHYFGDVATIVRDRA